MLGEKTVWVTFSPGSVCIFCYVEQKWLQRSQWAGEGGWHVGERFTVGESAKVTKLEKALQEKESKLQDMQAEIERLREALRDKNAEGEQDAVER